MLKEKQIAAQDFAWWRPNTVETLQHNLEAEMKRKKKLEKES